MALGNLTGPGELRMLLGYPVDLKGKVTDMVGQKGPLGFGPGADAVRAQPLKQIPPPPAYLTTEAKDAWKVTAREMIRYRMLTKLDLGSLEAYCNAISTLRECEKTLQKKGIIYTNDKGSIQKRPEAIMAKEARQQIGSFANSLGLTPSSRGRLCVPHAEKEDDLDKFNKKKRKSTKRK